MWILDVDKKNWGLTCKIVRKSGLKGRCSCSSAANYRAACRGKSTPDFINKLKMVEEELDESIFFLELLHHFNVKFEESFNNNIKEANELLAIIVASIKTARRNQ